MKRLPAIRHPQPRALVPLDWTPEPEPWPLWMAPLMGAFFCLLPGWYYLLGFSFSEGSSKLSWLYIGGAFFAASVAQCALSYCMQMMEGGGWLATRGNSSAARGDIRDSSSPALLGAPEVGRRCEAALLRPGETLSAAAPMPCAPNDSTVSSPQGTLLPVRRKISGAHSPSPRVGQALTISARGSSGTFAGAEMGRTAS